METKKSSKRRKKRKKISYRKRIMMIQTAALIMVFLLLILAGVGILSNTLSKLNPEPQEQNESNNNVDKQDDLENNQEESVNPSIQPTQIPTSTPTPTPEPTVQIETTEITVSMAGDCTIGADINSSSSKNLNAYYKKYQDYGYFFKNVRDIFAADDLTVVNFEGTLTESNSRRDKTFAFKGDPGYVQILTEGSVEAANLANNHSMDYGQQGYKDTITNLQNAGIYTFAEKETAIIEIKGIKVALIGIHEIFVGLDCKDNMIKYINNVIAEGAELIIVSFHWGTEKEYYPDDIQKELAHTAIDYGADLVVGHHPHVLQGIEEYKGKNIVYSLGNFCFGGNTNPADKSTMIFQQTFTFDNGVLRVDNNKNIIPCCLSSTWEYNDYCPTPLEGDKAQEVLDKIAKYSEGLSE